MSIFSCKKERTYEKVEFKNQYKFLDEIKKELEKDTTSWKYQAAAWEYSFSGDYSKALTSWGKMGGVDKKYKKEQVDSINEKYTKVNAVDYIVEEAKKHRITIINEAHHSSLHRVFTKSLLQNLYDEGYRNLGLEALSNRPYLDSLLNSRKYPIFDTGYYTKEVQFGNLIREALEIGYNVFAYESTDENAMGKFREIEQAKNIVKVIEQKPNEKFLIHCGFAHVYEGDYERWEKTMTGRIKEYTGINPLTINQVQFSERHKPEFNPPLYKAVNVKEPSILLDVNKKPYKYTIKDSYTDITVFHPITKYVNNRPEWLFTYKPVELSLTDAPIDFPVMVLVYKKGEAINKAIPVDIVEIIDATDKAYLALNKGNYNIVITNKKQESLKFDMHIK